MNNYKERKELRLLQVTTRLLTLSWCVVALILLTSFSATGVSLESLHLNRLQGGTVPASMLTKKVVLIVNVASRCGFTRQYNGLQEIYECYKSRGFLVLGVPCNQFAGQDPGSSKEVANFCKVNFGVEFPILEKQDVNGPNRSLLYQYPIDESPGGARDIGWNFDKFLVGRNGRVISRFGASTRPTGSTMVTAIEEALWAKMD